MSGLLSAMTWADWLILCSVIAFLLYLYGTWTFNRFKKHGFPQLDGPLPFVGHSLPLASGRLSVPEFMIHMHNKMEARGQPPAYGMFMFRQPTLVVQHPDLIKLVAIKDFDAFGDHQVFISDKLNPILGRGLFSLSGEEWREMRATLSPTFTSSKLRNMCQLFDTCGEQAVKFIDKQIAASSDRKFETEMKDFFTRMTNDCIATTAFGVQCDSLAEPDNEFYRMGRELTNTAGLRSLAFFGFLMAPKLMELLNVSVIPERLVQFFHRVFHAMVKERQEKNIVRRDFLQLLVEAKEGKLKVEKGDEHEAEEHKWEKRKLTDEDMTAQAVGFFFAGFETISTLMGFCAVTLARQPEAQQRLQREIDEVLEKHGGSASYDAIQEMKFLDCVINEVLRLYSGMGLGRVCTKDSYTFPEMDGMPSFTIRKGENVFVWAHAIHHDARYWPDPEKFDPERFNDKNKANIKPFTFMPFGAGPRICIGMRLALVETKSVLVHILRKFDFIPVPRTPKEPTWGKPDFAIGLQRNCWLGLVPRRN